ncbi:hypothetical protein [Idiomarina xiamenensis]|uniref:Anti-sigma factor n=1 Tax=Idiomarina xiamenensis 10-D-4 TaxID=740709 RepID=K2KHQ6_9GAMM|nr:hypothetical protein [Idiomarina xiamenensis]EKE87508.1 hypothetical protein A10D4_00390 [Idiomarina xiamenensis 10-D-4]
MNNWQQAFERWLDGELSASESDQLQRDLEQHEPELAKLMQQFQQLQQAADSWQPEPVPAWSPRQSYSVPVKPSGTRWWQGTGLSMTALACSLLAVCLVLLNVQVSVQDQQLRIAFGGAIQAEQLQQLVDQRVASLAAEQQQHLQQQVADLRQDIRQDMQDSTTQLASYVLATGRQERREDFADLIKYVNEQREDDQVFYAYQLRQLKETIPDQPIGYQPPRDNKQSATELED